MLYFIGSGVIIVIFIIWIISLKQIFILLDQNINNAMLQIEIQLLSSWDALITLLELAKEYSDQENMIMAKLQNIREPIAKDFSIDHVNSQENEIVETMSKIIALAENHLDLYEDVTYKQTVGAINQYKNMLGTSRLIYNETVNKLNIAIRMFPVSLVARMLGFRKKSLFLS